METFIDIEIENKLSILKTEIVAKRDSSEANSSEKKYYRKLARCIDQACRRSYGGKAYEKQNY